MQKNELTDLLYHFVHIHSGIRHSALPHYLDFKTLNILEVNTHIIKRSVISGPHILEDKKSYLTMVLSKLQH